MKHLKIRSKFLLLGFIGALAMVGVTMLALNINDTGVRNLNTVFSDSKKVQNLQRNYIAPLFRVRELSLSMVMAPNENFRKHIETSLTPHIKTLDTAFSLLEKPMQLMWHQYKYLVQTTLTHIHDGFEEGAFINANTAERRQFYALIDELEKLQIKQLERSSITHDKAQKSASQNSTLIYLTVAILGFISLVVGFVIINNIVDSIERVKTGLGRFFNYLGHRQDEVDTRGIELDNEDELGEMAQAINTQMQGVRDNLKKDMRLIEEATSLVNEIKSGKLDKRLHVKASSEELNTLQEVMNEMMDDLESKIQGEITRRADQEKLLIQQSKLASMGNMIGNIAHQWRQPLSELNAIIMHLQVRYMYDDFNEEFLNQQVDECNRITAYMSHTISDFQNFFKPSKTTEVFSVVEACKKASSILSSSLKHHEIDFTCKVDDDMEVEGYPNEFSQAFLNILSNAKDVLVERKVEDPFIHVSIKTGKQYVLIKVEDNGGGIKEEALERIFEPYFTTKHAKQGTGIGLYMSKTIIEGNMNGIIKVENTEQGACFTIKIAL